MSRGTLGCSLTMGLVRFAAVLAIASCAQGVPGEPADGVDGSIASTLADADVTEEADACASSAPEECNGVDDDCDGVADEDFDVGEPCDSDDSDLCDDDETACTADGAIECVDLGGDLLDVCNGQDDDCDAASDDGSEDPLVGLGCDGPDGDLCVEGVRECQSGSLVCTDTTSTTSDVCNGLDDDCDPASADGSEDPAVGDGCDGPDGDLCAEGTTVCSSGSVVCSDVTSTTIDVCNGIDDDCDPSSADGSEDPQVGLGCDGSDGDLCVEGTRQCIGGALSCSDTSAETTDVCNGIDDDCDPASADGDEDPLVGVACDGPDSDSCTEGVTTCSAGGQVTCSDNSGDSVETCNGVDDDCDGTTDEDFPRDTNPVCSGATDLGSVSGDLGPDSLSTSGYEERWYRLTITENSFTTSSYLSATVELDSPAGADFDLYVYCDACGGVLSGQSNQGTGVVDTVGIRRNDGALDETFDVLIEVRLFSSSVCDNWTLSVLSDTPVSVVTCN